MWTRSNPLNHQQRNCMCDLPVRRGSISGSSSSSNQTIFAPSTCQCPACALSSIKYILPSSLPFLKHFSRARTSSILQLLTTMCLAHASKNLRMDLFSMISTTRTRQCPSKLLASVPPKPSPHANNSPRPPTTAAPPPSPSSSFWSQQHAGALLLCRRRQLMLDIQEDAQRRSVLRSSNQLTRLQPRGQETYGSAPFHVHTRIPATSTILSLCTPCSAPQSSLYAPHPLPWPGSCLPLLTSQTLQLLP